MQVLGSIERFIGEVGKPIREASGGIDRTIEKGLESPDRLLLTVLPAN